jgi:hypothetical protein
MYEGFFGMPLRQATLAQVFLDPRRLGKFRRGLINPLLLPRFLAFATFPT